MTPVRKYPRVLIVVLTKVKAEDPSNLLIRTQFGNWSKADLAQIYSGETAGKGEFCGRYYALQAGDRFLGRLFMALRAGVFDMVAMDAVGQSPASHRAGRFSRWLKSAKHRFGSLLISSGVWEVIFRVRISAAMERFIESFKPDIIYCSGYSLAFTALPLLISRKYGIPICFQTLEDWPAYSYQYSPIGGVFRRQARRLISSAALRLAFGEKMQSLYEKRYRVPFYATYHLDSMERFHFTGSPHAEGMIKIIFTGSLVLNRHECIEDLLKAIRLIQKERPWVGIEVYCSGLPNELSEDLRSAPEVKFLPIPAHEDLPRVLHDADVLFLPEAFSVNIKRLDLAISTKCHLYMMAGRPILVYGPGYGGTIEYAREHGWALVVQQRDARILADAVCRLLDDHALVAELKSKAFKCFSRNHDLSAHRERFELLIEATAAGNKTRMLH
jgi:glycosyltransferase involved in cell wall biosynthesis